MGVIAEFRQFAIKGNVVDLAVGIIIGAAFGRIVNSLVTDIIMPPIGLLLGRVDFSELYINLSSRSYPSIAAAKSAGAPTVNYGVFLNQVVSFLIVAFAVFLLVGVINRLRRLEAERPTTPPAPTREETLLTEIRDLLRDRK